MIAKCPNCERNAKRIACPICGKANPRYTQRTHGMRYTATYKSWRAMKVRCFSPTHAAYQRYGGVGITVCPEWKDSFEAFFSDMGERPVGTTLDRFQNTAGNYEPGNCRWATATEQARNKSGTIFVTLGFESRPLSEWCEIKGIGRTTVKERVRLSGMTYEQALSTPARAYRHPRKGEDKCIVISAKARA